MGEREEVHLTEEQRKELQKLAAEMEVEAIKMRADYEQNPQPEMEGMVVSVHQDSVLLDDESVKLDADVAVEIKPKEKDNE
jgi:TRAP-type C4-dicarboxylate transport system substrate-binding protein